MAVTRTYFAELPDDLKAAVMRLEHCNAAVSALEIKLEHATAETANARGAVAQLFAHYMQRAATGEKFPGLGIAGAVERLPK